MAPQIDTCPIWGSNFRAKGSYIPQNRTIHVEESPRTGGGYEIDEVLVKSQIENMSYEEKARLTTWLIDQRSWDNQYPFVTEEIIKLARNKRPLHVHERAERLLRFVASDARTVADSVVIDEETYDPLYANAWSESTEWDEIIYFIKYLQEMGWIQDVISTIEGQHMMRITVAGHSRIAERETQVNSSQVFVAMWFDPQMDEAYGKGILPAIEDAGYIAVRIDRKADVNKIDDEIIAEIRKSRFIVADFTQGDGGARGGVYFEAGFALGLDLSVIYTCHRDSVDKLAFDTRQYNHIIWDTTEDLRTQLKNRILAVIGEGPLTP